jgi:hypothetical protein
MNRMRITKYEVKLKPLSSMRYKTLGDYYLKEDGTLFIDCADTGNWVYNNLIIQHELNEFTLITELGIDEKDILSFDAFHPDDGDPGLNPEAPYRDQHAICDSFDRIMLSHLGIPYKDYDDACNKIWEGK